MVSIIKAGIAAAVLSAAGIGGMFAGKELARNEGGTKPVPQYAVHAPISHAPISDYPNTPAPSTANDTQTTYDLDGDGSREIVYFPHMGPPIIYQQINGQYCSGAVQKDIYERAARLAEALARGRHDDAQKRALCAVMERETPQCLRPLVAYTALQQISFSNGGQIIPGTILTPRLLEAYNAASLTELLDPKSIALASFIVLADRVTKQRVEIGSTVYLRDPNNNGWYRDGDGNLWKDSIVRQQEEEHRRLTAQGAVKGPGGYVITEDRLRQNSDNDAKRAPYQQAAQQATQAVRQTNQAAQQAAQRAAQETYQRAQQVQQGINNLFQPQPKRKK